MSGRPSIVFSDRETLKKYRLDMPFLLDFKEKLKAIDINITEEKTLDEIVEKICQSK